MQHHKSNAVLHTFLLACFSLAVLSGCKYEDTDSTKHTESKETITTNPPPPDSVGAVLLIDSDKAIIDDVKK